MSYSKYELPSGYSRFPAPYPQPEGWLPGRIGSMSVLMPGEAIIPPPETPQLFDSGPLGSWLSVNPAPAYMRDVHHKMRILPGVANPNMQVTVTSNVNITGKVSAYKSSDGGVTWTYVTTLSGVLVADVPAVLSGVVTCLATDMLEFRGMSPFGTFTTISDASPGIYVASPAAPAIRAIVIGDSITADTAATIPLGWSNTISDDSPGPSWRFTTMGISGLDVHTLAPSDAQADICAAKVVARADGTTKNVAVVCLGVNDWINGYYTLATFTADYTRLIARLRLADPDIGLCIVTPLITASNDTAVNPTQGNTMAQYRSAIATIMGAYGDKVIVNGLAIMTNADQADNVHPNDAGMPKYAAAVKAALLATWGA